MKAQRHYAWPPTDFIFIKPHANTTRLPQNNRAHLYTNHTGRTELWILRVCTGSLRLPGLIGPVSLVPLTSSFPVVSWESVCVYIYKSPLLFHCALLHVEYSDLCATKDWSSGVSCVMGLLYVLMVLFEWSPFYKLRLLFYGLQKCNNRLTNEK